MPSPISPPSPNLAWLAARLKLRHFTLLVELDRCRSVSRAAERLGLAQPTVTRSLSEIEGIFMTPLFTRSRRGLEPTPAGSLVLARARLSLADAEGLGQDLAALGAGLQGRLRVGVIPFLSRQTQDTLWQHLLTLRPRMGFVAEEATTDVLQQALMARELDCAICRFTSIAAEAGLEQRFLYHQEPRLVVSRNAAERLARRGLDWEAFVAMQWIFPPQHTPVRAMIHSIFASAGQAVPKPFMEAFANKTLATVLRHMPDAITILPDDIAQEVADLSGARVMPQRLQWNLPPVGMVRLRDSPHAALIDAAAEVVRGGRSSTD
ncbi:MAG: transcriptional regulator, LysR family [Rhodoferax sp.]|nr:transcriptional regulator, LysR family [Rhodoferax sp.]